MKIRITGTQDEVPEAARLLGQVVAVLETSRLVPRRKSRLVSMYLEAGLPLAGSRRRQADVVGRVAGLHRPESRVRGSADPEEPDFYDICVHCTELLNTAQGSTGWQAEWPCPTAIAVGLPDLPVALPAANGAAVETDAPF